MGSSDAWLSVYLLPIRSHRLWAKHRSEETRLLLLRSQWPVHLLREDLLSESGGESKVLMIEVKKINEESKTEQVKTTEYYFKILSHHTHP